MASGSENAALFPNFPFVSVCGSCFPLLPRCLSLCPRLLSFRWHPSPTPQRSFPCPVPPFLCMPLLVSLPVSSISLHPFPLCLPRPRPPSPHLRRPLCLVTPFFFISFACVFARFINSSPSISFGFCVFPVPWGPCLRAPRTTFPLCLSFAPAPLFRAFCPVPTLSPFPLCLRLFHGPLHPSPKGPFRPVPPTPSSLYLCACLFPQPSP